MGFLKHQEISPNKNRLFSPSALRKLIIPLIIEQALAITVGMIDTIMISYAGEDAVSGVSLIDMLNSVIITIFGALATGGAVVSAQYIGAGEQDQAQASVQQLLAISFVISAFLTGVLLVLRTPVMSLLFGSIEQDVWDNAMMYLLVTAFSFPFIALYSAGAALFRSCGNSRVAMITSLISNLINFVGNAVFLFVFHWGVFGVALATLIARGAAMVVVLWLLSKKDQALYWDIRAKFRPDWKIIRKILHIGIPTSLESSFFQLGKIIIMSIVAAFGTSQIAANALGNNYASLGVIPGAGMNLAMLTVIGQCVGARDEEQIRYYTKKLMGMAYFYQFLINVVILSTLPLSIKIFNISEETERLTIILTWIHNGMAVLFWLSSFTLPNALKAANDVRYIMIVSISSMAVFRILFSFLLGYTFNLGVIGVWIAMIIDWIFRTIMFFLRVRGKKWIHRALQMQEAG